MSSTHNYKIQLSQALLAPVEGARSMSMEQGAREMLDKRSGES